MTLIKIPDTTYRGVTLPGGWTTRVPSVRVDVADARMRDMIHVLMRRGAPRHKAEPAAVSAVEDFFVKEWRARLMKTVGRWASAYADQNYGSLDGFDPSLVARTWVPGMVGGPPGRAGDVKRLFVEMRRSLETDA